VHVAQHKQEETDDELRMQFPIIKKLWTSPFVLVAAGYSAALLGLFYLILDVWQFRFWAYPFVWIGTNAITLYLLESIVSFPNLAERFIGGDFSAQFLQQYGPLCTSTLAILFLLLLARFLHTRQIFLRV
jgi:predicted acyltransferase